MYMFCGIIKECSTFSIPMKTCTKCQIEKPLEEFPNRTKSKDGKDYTCKMCHAENQRRYQLANRDKIRERRRPYKEKWYSENKDRLSEEYKIRYQENKEEILSYQKEYRLLNPGKCNHWKVKYKLAKKNATPSWANLKEIEMIYTNCPEGHHVDHIIPIQGKLVCGLHVENNLQYLPVEENLSKKNKFKVEL